METNEKISIYLHEYAELTKKIHINDTYLKENKHVLNFGELETWINTQRSLYVQFQRVIENKIINLNTNI
tara:strand:- start:6111 stop:6320 length:210 start_codon:yes stop_codon:yes gene_type:complete